MSSRSESEPVVTVTSLAVTPNFFFAASRPAAAESLNDYATSADVIARPTYLDAVDADGATNAVTVRVVATTATRRNIFFLLFQGIFLLGPERVI